MSLNKKKSVNKNKIQQILWEKTKTFAIIDKMVTFLFMNLLLNESLPDVNCDFKPSGKPSWESKNLFSSL